MSHFVTPIVTFLPLLLSTLIYSFLRGGGTKRRKVYGER